MGSRFRLGDPARFVIADVQVLHPAPEATRSAAAEALATPVSELRCSMVRRGAMRRPAAHGTARHIT